MSRKSLPDTFQTKTTRNDRFAQMSRQEQVIEQKKKEIQARKLKDAASSSDSGAKSTTDDGKKGGKVASKSKQGSSSPASKPATFNIFSNDGTFLDQFKQLSDGKKMDQKSGNASSKTDKKEFDRNFSDDKGKGSRWSRARTPSFSPTKEITKPKARFSDKQNFEQQTIQYTSFSNDMFTGVQPPQSQPNIQILQVPSAPPPMTLYTSGGNVLTAQDVGMTIPPPQVIQVSGGVVLQSPQNITSVINVLPLSSQSNITIPPPEIQTVELTTIPVANPISVSIPQPETINTLTIPPPAPIQIQNIPPPSPIRLNEIPNPKPIDLLNIPAPGEEPKKSITDPDFIKNVPPPNKSVPPPAINVNETISINVNVPPPNSTPTPPVVPSCLPPGVTTSLPPPNQIQTIPQQLLPQQTMQTAMVSLPVTNSAIPSLMAQSVLPPGMTVAPPPPMGMQCPPPLLNVPPPVSITTMPGPPPVLSQPPPTGQNLMQMTIPPPLTQQAIQPQQTIVSVVQNDVNSGSAGHAAMVSLGRMVAQCGPSIEDIVKQRKPQDPNLWFLFNKQSAAYQQYQRMVDQFRAELGVAVKKEPDDGYKPEDIYEPEKAIEDDEIKDMKSEVKSEADSDEDNYARRRKRKRRSRWGNQETMFPPPGVVQPGLVLPPKVVPLQTSAITNATPMLTKVTRNDPGLVQYAINTYGSSNLTEEEWKKAEDHYKINLLYQDMMRKRQELERLQKAGKNKYEYDSDEDTEGGTWEHKLRMQEMEATQLWANELTRQSEGKHHIGDFLPPDELRKFLEKSSAAKEGRQPNLSDYKEFKLKEDNIGFKMLQKLGWSEGQGLGSGGTGIVEPVSKAPVRDQNQGLGAEESEAMRNNDDEYESYRKRMMLAYRFRPNPLNNPRRPYY